MRNWIWIMPLLVIAGCSKPSAPGAAASNTNSMAPAPAAPQTSATVAAPPVLPGSSATPVPAPPPPPAATAPEASPLNRAPEAVAPPPRPELVIPRGVPLRVRLDRTIDTRRDRPGDGFTATLERPLVVRGETVLPAGARFRGHVTASAPSGRLEGRPVLGLTLDSFHLRGREVPIRTAVVERVGPRHKKRNGVLIGGGAGLGAIIGAIAGGGKGAAIGGLAGAGAGTAGAAATGKEELTLSAETPLVFTTRAPVRM